VCLPSDGHLIALFCWPSFDEFTAFIVPCLAFMRDARASFIFAKLKANIYIIYIMCMCAGVCVQICKNTPSYVFVCMCVCALVLTLPFPFSTGVPMAASMVLQWCHSGVTVVLLWCYSVTVV
jgi:hypothetical protein